jgi:hypothetical protein
VFSAIKPFLFAWLLWLVPRISRRRRRAAPLTRNVPSVLTVCCVYVLCAQSVRLSKHGIYHVSSGDRKDRSNDAMRLNWGLGTPLPDLSSL